MKLRDLVDKHPEWIDRELVVYRQDGGYDWVGAAGSVYEDETCGHDVLCHDFGSCDKKVKVLVFAPN